MASVAKVPETRSTTASVVAPKMIFGKTPIGDDEDDQGHPGGQFEAVDVVELMPLPLRRSARRG